MPALVKPSKVSGDSKRVDAARDGGGAVPGVDRFRGAMDGDQRARAGGLDGDAGPVEIEMEADAVRADRRREPGHGIAFGRAACLPDEAAIAGVGDADEDADVRAPKAARRIACVFQQPPRVRQQEALLRIDDSRLGSREAEEGGVELADAVDEAATGCDARRAGRGPICRQVRRGWRRVP